MRIRLSFTVAAIALLFVLCAPLSAALARTTVDERHPLAAGGRVQVQNVAGSVRVRTWDRDEVAITGTLDADLRLEVDASRSRVHVRVVYPRNSRGSRGAELELRVPAGAELEANVVSARLEATDVDLRRLHLKSVSGDIRASGRAGETELESVSGRIQAGVATPRFSATTVSGRIDADGGIEGDASVRSVSGSVSLATGRVEQLRGESVSGGLSVSAGAFAPGGRIRLETVSGRIGLRLPADASARLRVSSFSGSINSDAGEVERPRYGPGRSLDTRLGDGDGDVSIQSHSGAVRVELGR